MKIQVTIEQSDIDNATPHCGTECAALWALRRVFGADVIDRVTRAYVVFADKTRKRSPKALREFCRDFDRGGREAVKPLTFVFDV